MYDKTANFRDFSEFSSLELPKGLKKWLKIGNFCSYSPIWRNGIFYGNEKSGSKNVISLQKMRLDFLSFFVILNSHKINLDGTYSDNENETKRLRSNSGLNSRNADSLSNQNRSSGRNSSSFYYWFYFYVLEADFLRSSKHPCPHHVLEESRNLKKENEALKERVSKGVPF